MIKRLTAFILTLAALCSLLTACGAWQAGGDADAAELDDSAHRLLADWYAYTVRCEYLYGDMVWALSYLEPFFEDHSWASLQTARAALYLAERRAELLEPPEAAQMSLDDYDRLIQSGADVGPVQDAFDSLSSLKNSVLLEYALYRNNLNSPGEAFFLTYQLSYFEDWASLIRQIYELYLQNCAIETDYVLLEVDSEEESRFVESIAETCPKINARRADNPQDPDALLEKMGSLADELERLNGELSATVGQAQVNLDLYKEQMERGIPGDEDTLAQFNAAMAADAVELTGFPAALPYPDWWYVQEDETSLYTWTGDGDSKKSSVMPGDAIESPPDQYYVNWPGVSLDAYHDYLDALGSYGIFAEFITETDGKHTAFFQDQTGSFALIWEETEVSFFTEEGSVCFAPPWYVIQSRQVNF